MPSSMCISNYECYDRRGDLVSPFAIRQHQKQTQQENGCGGVSNFIIECINNRSNRMNNWNSGTALFKYFSKDGLIQRADRFIT